MHRLSYDQLLAEVEELRARTGPEPAERAALAKERHRLKERERLRELDRQRPKCGVCKTRPPVGWVRPEKRTLFACDVCFVPATGARLNLHEVWLTRLVADRSGDEPAEAIRNIIHRMAGDRVEAQARRDAYAKNLAAAAKMPWDPKAKPVRVYDEDAEAERARREAYKPPVRLVRTALRFDPRFTYEPPERPFEEGWWSWERAE